MLGQVARPEGVGGVRKIRLRFAAVHVRVGRRVYNEVRPVLFQGAADGSGVGDVQLRPGGRHHVVPLTGQQLL